MSFLSHGAGLEVLGELSQPVADSGVASSFGLAVSPFHPVPLSHRHFRIPPRGLIIRTLRLDWGSS